MSGSGVGTDGRGVEVEKERMKEEELSERVSLVADEWFMFQVSLKASRIFESHFTTIYFSEQGP